MTEPDWVALDALFTDLLHTEDDALRAARDAASAAGMPAIEVSAQHAKLLSLWVRIARARRVLEIGAEEGIPSYLIADGSALQPEWVKDAEVVGLTAGASAPEVLVDSVIDALGRLGPVEVSTLPGREEHMEFRLPAELTEGFATRTVSRAS